MPPIGDNKIVGSMDIARIPAKILAEPVRSKTYKEIAKELNVSIKLVEYRIQQALRLLRVELKDYLPLITIIFPYFL